MGYSKDYTGKSKYTIAIALLILVVALVGYYIFSAFGSSKLDFVSGENLESSDFTTKDDLLNFSGSDEEDSEHKKENIYYNLDIISYNDCVVVSFPFFEKETGDLLHKYHNWKAFTNGVTTNRYYVFRKLNLGNTYRLILEKMIYIDDYITFFVAVSDREYHSLNVGDLTTSDLTKKTYTSIDNEVINYFADETQNLIYGSISKVNSYGNSGVKFKYVDYDSLSQVESICRISMNSNFSLSEITEYIRVLTLSADENGSGYYYGYSNNMFTVHNCSNGKNVTDEVNVFARVHYESVNKGILACKDKDLEKGGYIFEWISESKYTIPMLYIGVYEEVSGNTATSTDIIPVVKSMVLSVSDTDDTDDSDNDDKNNNGNNGGTGGGIVEDNDKVVEV